MKILVLGAFGPGAMENFYLRGFEKQQFIYETFDITHDYYTAVNSSVLHKIINKITPQNFYDGINKRLLTFIDKRMYDVILVFKGLTLYESTIENLKLHANLLCCYNPDHPFKFFSEGSGNKNILNSIKFYNIYFSYSKKIVNSLQKDFGKISFVIPFGYDEDAKQSQEPLIDCKENFVFIGAYDRHRAAVLNKLHVNNLIIFGDKKWKSRTLGLRRIQKSFAGYSIYANDYIDAVSSAAGTLNFLRPQNIEESSHNMRTFEVPGYGGLLISNRTEEQCEYFEEEKEAVYFNSIDELKSKLLFLNKNSNLIEKIKAAARLRSLNSNYSYLDRSIQMAGIFKKYL